MVEFFSCEQTLWKNREDGEDGEWWFYIVEAQIWNLFVGSEIRVSILRYITPQLTSSLETGIECNINLFHNNYYHGKDYICSRYSIVLDVTSKCHTVFWGKGGQFLSMVPNCVDSFYFI